MTKMVAVASSASADVERDQTQTLTLTALATHVTQIVSSRKARSMAEGTFDLGDHRDKILSAFKRGAEQVEVEGRLFSLRKQELNNVDYLIVSPVGAALVPCANFVINEEQFGREMGSRGSEFPTPRKSAQRG
jgi:hypothetical protein